MTATHTEVDLPAHVGVVGAGRMGAGIAHAFLSGGSTVTVTVVDVDEAAAAAAYAKVSDTVAASVERGTLAAGVEETVARLDAGASFGLLAGCDLVVEAVPEDLALKHAVLARLGAVLAPTAVLASNTSSFSISALAAHTPSPERFLGLHFFNPVPRSRLVEVVVGAATDAAVVRRAEGWVDALGKTAVTVADSPGFATSRLGLALGLEAIRMVEDGVASAADIDTAMTLGYQHPVGPLRLTDLVGLDVRLGVADYLAEELGERFAAPKLLRDKVAAGELGRKTGRGFHDW